MPSQNKLVTRKYPRQGRQGEISALAFFRNTAGIIRGLVRFPIRVEWRDKQKEARNGDSKRHLHIVWIHNNSRYFQLSSFLPQIILHTRFHSESSNPKWGTYFSLSWLSQGHEFQSQTYYSSFSCCRITCLECNRYCHSRQIASHASRVFVLLQRRSRGKSFRYGIGYGAMKRGNRKRENFGVVA
jgi:hypothetical protein